MTVKIGLRLKPNGQKLVDEIVDEMGVNPATVIAAAMDRLAAPDMRPFAFKWLTQDTVYKSNGRYDTKIIDHNP